MANPEKHNERPGMIPLWIQHCLDWLYTRYWKSRYQLSPPLKYRLNSRLLKILTRLLPIYILTWVVLWAAFVYKDTEFVIFVKNTLGRDISISLFASLAEDLIFFGVFSFLLLSWTLTRPEEEAFATRINHLFSDKRASKGPKVYLEEKLRKMGVFGANGWVEIIIHEYNNELNALRVEVKNNFNLFNMFKDETYQDAGITVYLDLDQCPSGNLMPGGVSVLETQAFSENHLEPRPVSEIPHTLDCTSNYEQKVPLQIPAGGSLGLRYDYWLWSALNIPLNVGVHRYSENIEISLLNVSDKEINYDLSADGLVKSGTLKSHQTEPTIIDKKARLFPGKDLKVIWC